MVAAPPAAAAAAALGLHCYGLAVQGVTIDGHPATFELVQPVRWVWRIVQLQLLPCAPHAAAHACCSLCCHATLVNHPAACNSQGGAAAVGDGRRL